MKFYLNFLILVGLIFSQNYAVYSDIELDSIVSSKIKSTQLYFAIGAGLVALDSDFENGIAFAGSSLLAYSLLIGTNSLYYQLGFYKKGLEKTLTKTALTSLTFILIGALTADKDPFDRPSQSEENVRAIPAILAALAVNLYISNSEIDDFKKLYNEDNGVFTLSPKMDYSSKSYSLAFNYTF